MKYFVVPDGGPVPQALVRVDQGVETTFTGEGEWVESNLRAGRSRVAR